MSPADGTPDAGRARRDAGRRDVHIDRLALRAAGLDEDAARALARLVAEGLTPGLLRPAGLAGVGSLQVEVQASAAEQGNPDLLARRIVDEIGRVLARDRRLGRTGRGGGRMSGVVLKGALVKFTPTFLPVPVPNVIIFQYNPETMTHTWTQPEPAPPSAPRRGQRRPATRSR